jgi:hypothetical protein
MQRICRLLMSYEPLTPGRRTRRGTEVSVGMRCAFPPYAEGLSRRHESVRGSEAGIGRPSSRATARQASIARSNSLSASAGVSPKAEHHCRSGTLATHMPSGSDQKRLA